MAEAKKRFDELDGLKIFFALWVVLHHYWTHIADCDMSKCPKCFEFIYKNGWLSNYFFFMLSGFVMEYSYRNIIINMNFFSYLGQRLKKLYFPCFFATIIGIFLSFIDFILLDGHFIWGIGHEITASKILASITMSSFGWNTERFPFMEVTWFINVLFLCYVVYFLLVHLSNNIKIYTIYIYTAFLLFAFFGGAKIGFKFPFILTNTCYAYSCFFIGCILYNIQQYGYCTQKQCILTFDFFIMILCLLSYKFGTEKIWGDLPYVFSFLVFPVLILTVENLPGIKKVLSCKILTFASRYSMDIFLSHMAILWSTLIFNQYFGWNLNFASYKVLGCIMLTIFALAFVWHQLMAIVTPAFNRWFVSFIAPAKAEKTEA